VRVSLLTRALLCERIYSATARNEHEAKRNANGTASGLEEVVPMGVRMKSGMGKWKL